MERDFNLIRRILLSVETKPVGELLQDLLYDDTDQYIVAEHVRIMIEEGLIDGKVTDYINGMPPGYLIRRLTWKGHDFLANAKNDTIWKKVMSEAKEKGTSMTTVVINGLLTKAVQKYAGLE